MTSPRVRVIGKVNKDNFVQFAHNDFPGYEIYLAGAEDFAALPRMLKRLRVISVHQPGGRVNLCRQKDAAYALSILTRLVKKLHACHYQGLLVIHGCNYDAMKETRANCLRRTAQQLNVLNRLCRNNITLTLETDVSFFNQIKTNAALLCMPGDFKDLGQLLQFPLHITLDFEHIWITSLFRQFLTVYPDHAVEIKTVADLTHPKVHKVKKIWMQYLKKPKAKLLAIVTQSLTDFTSLRSAINHFHINGTNPVRYWFDPIRFLPLLGEHLLIREFGDKMEYRLIATCLPRLTRNTIANLTLEIMPRTDFTHTYTPALLASRDNLTRIFS